MPIVALDPTHATAAAQLHIAGQPDTFLTRLGPGVLTALYRALPQSAAGFGFAALADGTQTTPQVIGFISATTSTGRLFLELGTRHLPAFLPPLLRRFAQQPGLLLHCGQTLIYPWLHSQRDQPATAQPPAELLSIMVEPAWRSQGVGAQLVDQLILACRDRQIGALEVTVAADNPGAQRFYQRHGFHYQSSFPLYGRPMYSYQRTV